MNWSKIITEILEYNHLDALGLHNKTGISREFIYHLRSGIRKEPRFSIAMKLLRLHPRRDELLK